MGDALHQVDHDDTHTHTLLRYHTHTLLRYHTHTLLRYHKSISVANGSVSTLDGTGVAVLGVTDTAV